MERCIVTLNNYGPLHGLICNNPVVAGGSRGPYCSVHVRRYGKSPNCLEFYTNNSSDTLTQNKCEQPT